MLKAIKIHIGIYQNANIVCCNRFSYGDITPKFLHGNSKWILIRMPSDKIDEQKNNMCKNKCCRQTNATSWNEPKRLSLTKPQRLNWRWATQALYCENVIHMLIFISFSFFPIFFCFYVAVFVVVWFKFKLMQHGPAAQYPIRTTYFGFFIFCSIVFPSSFDISDKYSSPNSASQRTVHFSNIITLNFSLFIVAMFIR